MKRHYKKPIAYPLVMSLFLLFFSLFVFSNYSSLAIADSKNSNLLSTSEFSNQTMYQERKIFHLTDEPILEIYPFNLFPHAEKTLEEIEELASNHEIPSDYAVFHKDGTISRYSIGITKDGKKYAINRWEKQSEYGKNYLEAIAKLNKTEMILGKRTEISHIICFDATFSGFGTSVILKTNNGSFVYFFPDFSVQEPAVFSAEEFLQYATEYYQTLCETTVPVTEAKWIAGKSAGFLSFVEQRRSDLIDIDSITPSPVEPVSNWWWLLIPAVLLVGGGVGLIFICKRRKTA